jgi:hypothetical protein
MTEVKTLESELMSACGGGVSGVLGVGGVAPQLSPPMPPTASSSTSSSTSPSPTSPAMLSPGRTLRRNSMLPGRMEPGSRSERREAARDDRSAAGLMPGDLSEYVYFFSYTHQ